MNLASACKPLPHSATLGPADPDEVDISSHTYASAYDPNEPPASAEDEVLRFLRSPAHNIPTHPVGDGSSFRVDAGNESFSSILQQLVGGSMAIDRGRGGQQGDGDQSALPPGLSAVLGAFGAVGPAKGLGDVKKQGNDRFGYVWRITHALCAVALGIYMVFVTAFNGAQFSRGDEGGPTGAKAGDRFFWAFATAQLGLQSTRYFLERDGGPLRGEGWISMMAGAFSEPWRSRIFLLSRYSLIFSTVVQDAMLVVFVLGCVTWWEGEVA